MSARRKKGDSCRSGLLFPDKSGKPVDPDFFNSLFAKIKKSAGLKELRFHDLRHFFASLLISQGFSPKYVCDQLGALKYPDDLRQIRSLINREEESPKYMDLPPKVRQTAKMQNSANGGRHHEFVSEAV